ncbi:hypothetical protein [Brevibacillus sp. SIMBA_076]|uniref:hypothetical protein n=1 Tax=Brevibacillus sp. SIMBA_076 TaxID=3085814 RepID=UPI00397D3DEF
MVPGGATREVLLSGEPIRGHQERNPELIYGAATTFTLPRESARSGQSSLPCRT